MGKRGDDLDGGGSGGDGLAERLRRILRAEGDEELLLDGGEADAAVLRWIQALDLQVLGACRADERLKPLLKLNLSAGAAEDHLMAQLNQHFDVTEIGMLLRCLCVPLVSMRVGRVNKIGTMLFPTNIRGSLNLMLSPLSEMRLLFCGDDGCHERLGVDHILEKSEISVKEIPDDTTGRSFSLKLPGEKILYFWSSEKSKPRGSELLEKMNNLFQQRPSLSQLTGISDSRLDSFASYWMTNVASSVNSMELKSDSLSDSTTSSSASLTHLSAFNHQFFSTMLKPHRPHQSFSQLGKQNPIYQGSLSRRSNAFKEGPGRTLRNGVREKLKRRVDDDYSSSLVSDMTSVTANTFPDSSSTLPIGQGLKDQMEDMPNHCPIPLSLPMPSPLALPLSSLAPLSVCLSVPNIPVSSSSLLSPYYCLCPPSSSVQHVAAPPNLPLMPDPMALPPLSSLLPNVGSSLYIPTAMCDSNELPALDLPALLPPSSYMSISSSQQLLSFTPFVAEPIVHIPVIEVCSSGPGYLVSAGPAITSTIPLLPKLTGPLAPDTESLAEKNARETLRMLMASTPSNPQLMKVLPVLTSVDENILNIHGKKQGLVAAGSRGLYVATGDVDCVTNSISCIDLMPSTKDSPVDEGDDADGIQLVEDSEQMQSTQESENSKSNSIR